MNLIAEIGRCPAIFHPATTEGLNAIPSAGQRAIIRRKNGTLALSGALVVFGLGSKGLPLDARTYQSGLWRVDYGLQDDDAILGADIFGDLLFLRGTDVFRLDGEQGEQIALGDLEEFLSSDVSVVAENLGGNLARTKFAGQPLGADPLRLLPTYPFMMKENVPREFFEVPLSLALRLKHRLFLTCQSAPEGAAVDCSFWGQPP
jgi:hypothetical protein